MIWLWLAAKGRSAWAFAKTPLGVTIAATALIIAMLTVLYLTGRHHGMLAERLRWEKKEAAYVEAARKLEAATLQIAMDIRDKYEARIKDVKANAATITERIPRYVTKKSDRPVPSGFVSVFNASAEGTELPATPRGPVDAPSDVTLSAVAEVAAYNHGVALQALAENEAWREWYPRQCEEWIRRGLTCAGAAGLRGPTE